MATLKLFSLSVLAASALAISTPAMADTKAKEVQYQDLDLSTAKGQARLKTRVRQAVKQVCESPRAMTFKERADLNLCEANAIAKAMPEAEERIAAYIESRRFASREDETVAGN